MCVQLLYRQIIDMERWCGRVALVTGASVGIGAAIVKKLVTAGMKVVGAARNIDKIQVQYSTLYRAESSPVVICEA